jgi:hypothetical protein
MVAVWSVTVPVILAIAGAAWALSSRLTSQDIWIQSIHYRVRRLEHKAGTDGWDIDGDDEG